MIRKKNSNRDVEILGLDEENTEIYPKRITDYRKRWAIVIGVKDYRDLTQTGLSNLKNTVNDACLIYRILVYKYGFKGKLFCKRENVMEFEQSFQSLEYPSIEAEVVGNGTRVDIIDGLDEIAKFANSEDLLLFFYAGYGTNEGQGFMVPYGAINSRHETYLMYEELFGTLSALPCKHKILFLIAAMQVL